MALASLGFAAWLVQEPQTCQPKGRETADRQQQTIQRNNTDYGNTGITNPRRKPRFEGETGLQDDSWRGIGTEAAAGKEKGVRHHQDRRLSRSNGRREARQSNSP